MTSSSSEKPTVPASARTRVDGVEVWDLREKPSRGDVGMTEKKSTSTFVTDKARPIEVLLPGGVKVSTKAEIVAFESMTSQLYGSTAPSGLDVSTGILDPDDGYEMFTSNLAALGLPTAKADEWRALTEKAPRDDPNAPRINVSTGKRVGYLEFGLNIKYFPLEGNAKIQWTLYWGPNPVKDRDKLGS